MLPFNNVILRENTLWVLKKWLSESFFCNSAQLSVEDWLDAEASSSRKGTQPRPVRPWLLGAPAWASSHERSGLSLIYTRETVLSSSIISQKAVELKITAQETHLKRGKGSIVLTRGWVQPDSPFSDHVGKGKLPIGKELPKHQGLRELHLRLASNCSPHMGFCSPASHTSGIFSFLCFHLQLSREIFPRHMKDTALFLFVPCPFRGSYTPHS